MSFKAKLIRHPAGWTFAVIPKKHTPPATHPWGRTPVTATVNGASWDTSVWRDKTHGCLLALPKRIRGAKKEGDTVTVDLKPRIEAQSRP